MDDKRKNDKKTQIKNRIKQFVELIRLHRPIDLPYRMTLQYLLPLRFCQVSRIERLSYNDKLLVKRMQT